MHLVWTLHSQFGSLQVLVSMKIILAQIANQCTALHCTFPLNCHSDQLFQRMAQIRAMAVLICECGPFHGDVSRACHFQHTHTHTLIREREGNAHRSDYCQKQTSQRGLKCKCTYAMQAELSKPSSKQNKTNQTKRYQNSNPIGSVCVCIHYSHSIKQKLVWNYLRHISVA